MYLFICERRGGRFGDPCHDLGEYRSISCSFNGLVFIIHGFSSSLNRITWLPCKDSGFGDPHMGNAMTLTSRLDLQCQNYTPMSLVCLGTLPVNVCDL